MSSDHDPCDIPLYWLVYRDPYIGFLQSLYNWAPYNPLYIPTNHGLFLARLFTPSFFGQIAKLGAEINRREIAYHWVEVGGFHNHGNPRFQWFVITHISIDISRNDSTIQAYFFSWEFGVQGNLVFWLFGYMSMCCLWIMYCRVSIFDFT